MNGFDPIILFLEELLMLCLELCNSCLKNHVVLGPLGSALWVLYVFLLGSLYWRRGDPVSEMNVSWSWASSIRSLCYKYPLYLAKTPAKFSSYLVVNFMIRTIPKYRPAIACLNQGWLFLPTSTLKSSKLKVVNKESWDDILLYVLNPSNSIQKTDLIEKKLGKVYEIAALAIWYSPSLHEHFVHFLFIYHSTDSLCLFFHLLIYINRIIKSGTILQVISHFWFESFQIFKTYIP